MPSENSIDECFSQGDKSDGGLDLLSLVQDDPKDAIIVVEDDSPQKAPIDVDDSSPEVPIDVDNSSPKVPIDVDDSSPKAPIDVDDSSPKAHIDTDEAKKCTQSSNSEQLLKTSSPAVVPEILKAHPLTPTDSKSFNNKQIKTNQQRKPNNRYRSNKRSSFKSNRTNNIDNVDKWKHNGFEMLYGNSTVTTTSNVETFTVVGGDNNHKTRSSNVEEIKGCIVSKLQTLTLSNANNDTKPTTTTPTLKLDDNNRAPNRRNRDSTYHNHKYHKPNIPVVVTDNTKKLGERKSPICSPPLQIPPRSSSTAAQQFTNYGSHKNSNDDMNSIHLNQAKPSSASFKVVQTPPPQTTTTTTTTNTTGPNSSKVIRNKPPLPYYPRANNKKYFDSYTPQNDTRPTPTAVATTFTTNHNPQQHLNDSINYQPQTNYPEPMYYFDQNYYYYPNAPPYYPANNTDIPPFQPPVYFQPGYNTPNVYYNDNSPQPQFPYYNQQMYNEGFYYQPPMMDPYFNQDQQYYDTTQRANNYRWGGGPTNYQHRSPRRH